MKKALNIICDSDLKLTAFHIVCFNGRIDIVEIFVKYLDDLIIDLDFRDNLGMSAFHYAC